MHYKNGREAKSGDQVITRDWTQKVVVGTIHTLNAQSDTCNCTVAVVVPGGVNQLSAQSIKDCYHAEDALAEQAALSSSDLLERIGGMWRDMLDYQPGMSPEHATSYNLGYNQALHDVITEINRSNAGGQR